MCSDLNAECVYREPGIKLDTGGKLILDHLARIETLLHSNLQNQEPHLAPSATSPATSNDTNLGSDDPSTRTSSRGLPVHRRLSAVGLSPRVRLPTLHPLHLPLIRDLVSRL
ncbi:unnamed protein product [Penicillium roqueforti FM164]|uniref:Genomic scaffold, ProqFM164S01 n=1 Tax=Penicillium roqueforti (strain FM164) TaxID=1365484 RepID=W6PY65_PENRF|nr:unnamed protein product [Penicillium roqueforti FM164]